MNKVNYLAALLKYRLPTTRFNTGNRKPEESVRELQLVLQKCGELRNKIMHSSWQGSYYQDGKIVRRKISIRSKHGHREQLEELTPGMILDISDYIIYADYILDEFFNIFEPK
jgi:hypothetical protein